MSKSTQEKPVKTIHPMLKKLSHRITKITAMVDGETEEFQIRKLSVAGRERYFEENKAEGANQWAIILAMCVCDDDGNLISTPEDYKELDGELVMQLGVECLKVNHLTQKDFEALQKNLNGTDSGPIASVSPSNSDAHPTSSLKE